MLKTEEAVTLIKHWREHPVTFIEQMFRPNEGVRPHQAELLNAVASGERKVTMRSGRRVGKTTSMAWLSAWWLMTRPDARVVVTAPSSSQLEDAFKPEFRKWIQRLPEEVRTMWVLTADKFHWRMAEDQGYESFVTCRTARADQPESLQGINAPNTLVLPDEAAGVPDAVLSSLSGSMGDDRSQMVLTGNPNRDTGYFYDTHFGPIRDDWYKIHVNSEDVPSVSRDWIEEMAQKYGRSSNEFRVHVLGEPPTAADMNLIARELAQSATTRDVAVTPNEPPIWGLDVARYGDDESVLCKRQGNHVAPLTVWRNLDTQQLAMQIHSEYKSSHNKPAWIMVDSIGIGAGVVDRLREMDLPVRGINVSESPGSESYHKLKDELWDKCRAWLERRDVKLPEDQTLVNQLISVRKDFTPSGKMRVESKRDMRKRGEASPDRADALVLTFSATHGKALYGTVRSRKGPKKRRIPGLP